MVNDVWRSVRVHISQCQDDKLERYLAQRKQFIVKRKGYIAKRKQYIVDRK